VKDQYVGDINDFEKYAILRALRNASKLPLVVCWMLTKPDATGEGAKTDYLRQPDRYRELDPHVFDRLREIVRTRNRSVRAVEEAGVLEDATFFSRHLEDDPASRDTYFRDLWRVVEGRSLIFFDPDVGLAPNSVHRGGRRSAMYLFDDEICDAHRRGHSLVVYQHFAREQRSVYLERLFTRMRGACGAESLVALWSARVAFVIVPQEGVVSAMTDAAHDLVSRWSPLLSRTD
jgi:hypothetical protein